MVRVTCAKYISWPLTTRSQRERNTRPRTNMKTMEQTKMPSPIFIGRWTPKILFSLRERPHRHGELRRRLGSVSQRMLTRTLRNLESTGLIVRRVTRSKSTAVEYSLTQLGRTIIAPLRGMCHWARRYRREVSADVHLPGKTADAR
jgi:DNA-binding HxlR family transcriptional regulator